MNIKEYWNAVLRQKPGDIKPFFAENAYVNWHNTNEHFTAREFIKVNCEYPGEWCGELEKVIEAGELIITAVHVFSKHGEQSFHVTSFFRIANDKITAVDEYWGDDGEAPQWRTDKSIGTPIK